MFPRILALMDKGAPVSVLFTDQEAEQSSLLYCELIQRARYGESFIIKNQGCKVGAYVLGETGIPTWQNPPYLNFSREIYRLAKRFSGNQLRKMADAAMVKWVFLDLEQPILEEIRNTIFTLTAPAP